MSFIETLIGDVLTFQRGFDITKAEQTEGEIPIVSSSGTSSFHNRWKVAAPGIVIGRKGTLGTTHFLASNFWPHDTTLWVKDFKGNDPKFLYYFLQTLHLENFDTGSSNPTLNRNHVHKIKIQFPQALETQQKIAAILSAYDDLIANNQRRITLLERMAEDIYREWFVRLRFPGHQQGKLEKGLPQGWRVETLGDVFKTSSGGTPSRTEPTNFGGDIPWIKTGELKTTFALGSEETLTRRGVENSAAKVYKKHTVVMAMYCAMPDLSVIANDAATNQACCAFIPHDPTIHHSFSFFLIKFAQLQLVMFAHGAAQQNLSQEIIKRFPVLLPSKHLISAFGQKVKPLFDAIEALIRANVQLKTTRDALLPRLISGKLAVDELDIRFPPSMASPQGVK